MKPQAMARRLASEGWGRVFWTLWLLAALGFAIMAGFAAAANYFPADLWLSHRLQDVDADAFSEALDWASRLAEMPLVVLVALGAALALALLARHLGAMWLVAALVVSLADTPVKLLVDRPRPAGDLVQVSEKTASAAFPSGHATAAVLVYGFIFYLAGFLIPARLWRFVVQASCLVVILLTGLQRVYVGAHWPSDVLGGLLFGGLLLALLIWSHRRFGFLLTVRWPLDRAGKEQ
jgi:membrane-associated phospholipid phosphatase